ncbi:MAG TPA: carboxypeptidase regulatory-like domain-containing protein [Terriglobales bacterium]|nr:carboxypeptidase regulatory-like domain-containing protein [Terriglobales bacterium]
MGESTQRRMAAGWIVATLILGSLLVCAQTPWGTLRGVVRDGSGARVASASISIHRVGSGEKRLAKTDSSGEFQVSDLTPGLYQVQVASGGFADAQSNVRVTVSSTQEIAVVLQPVLASETVTVHGAASSITLQPLNTSNAVQEGVVTAQDLESFPLAHRSFANIAYLVPGTEPVEPSDPTKARITAVSFGGSSGLNVELSVDGVDNSDDYIGGFLQNFSPDAIQEFTVRTAQEEADTSGTTGGSVVITTRRGTNQWHGEGAFYERGAALNARFPIDNPAPQPKQPFSRQNYIGTLGGPIKHDKLWFFSSLEYVHENASIAYSPASLAQFNALASLASQRVIPGVNSIAVPSNVPVPFDDAMPMARLDWNQSPRSQWFLRVALDRYTTGNDLVQQATLPSTGVTSRGRYLNIALNQQYTFSPTWLGSFTFGASTLQHTETRNQELGFALAFPFSSTYRTISGFETFGDNQFVTPITAFPVSRNQDKYQFRYDLSHTSGRHSPRLGLSFIHEPVLSGALSGTAETLVTYPNNPVFYAQNPSQFYFSSQCAVPPPADSGIDCELTPAGNGSFAQNVQRLGGYFQDSWRITPRLTVNYGLRYDTTFGLFTASGRSQLENMALPTLRALQIPLISGAPQDYRLAFAPRLGIAYGLGESAKTVIRAGIGLFYDDLAQNGWVTAFQAVNAPPLLCLRPGDPGCIPGSAAGGSGAVIDPNYHTPYSMHATAGVEHAFSPKWTLSADWTHEQGMHGYRLYQYQAGYTLFSPLFPQTVAGQKATVPDLAMFRSDNRSSYDALMVHLQGNVSRRFSLTANYTLSSARTWGCVVGELFDYVNGVCNPLHAFAQGDYGPSGEDARHRFVLAGTFSAPGGLEITTLSQAESARPFTLTTPVDVNGVGSSFGGRAVINGVQTGLDEFRGTPYVQIDLRVSRPISIHERWSVTPFLEFFNLLNRNNPANNYITDLAALPTPVNNLANATAFCLNATCTQTTPITSLNQLRVPAGALGDFFGPGTTVGIPLAAQVGVRVAF